jgi:cytochrome c-type biogenesis protein CcmE
VNRQARTRLIVATVVIVAVFVAGVVYLIGKQGAYYRQVSELSGEQYVGKNVKVGGRVLGETIVHDATGVHFILQDLSGEADTVKVDYDGQMPDTFGPGVDVVVVGDYSEAGEGGLITAHELQTKCPSKYEGEGTTPVAPSTP